MSARRDSVAEQEYCCGFLVNDADLLVLLRKTHPAWQAGKLNGVGGKLETNETPLQAMEREWGEETGDDTRWPWRHFSTQRGPGYAVHFFVARCTRHPALPGVNDVGERFEYRYAAEVIAGNCGAVIPNLPWLLAAALRDPAMLFLDVREIR